MKNNIFDNCMNRAFSKCHYCYILSHGKLSYLQNQSVYFFLKHPVLTNRVGGTQIIPQEEAILAKPPLQGGGDSAVHYLDMENTSLRPKVSMN